MAGNEDFDRLLASIQKVNAEMKTLVSNIARAKQELAQTQVPAERQALGRSIGGYQAALSKKTQQSTSLASESLSSIRTEKALKSSISPADVERRMNLITIGVPLTNAEITAKGKEVASRVLAQQKEITRQLQISNQPSVSTIGTPPGPTPPTTIQSSGGLPDIFGGASTDKKKKAVVEEEKLLTTLRERIAAESKYTKALEQAYKLGYSLNDLKKVQTRGTAGIEQLQFEKRDASTGGINKRFETFVNPEGKATPGLSNQFRTFGQGVLRDIGELTKWSIALAAVYGPMKKIQELTQVMIENQTKLAEASIAASSSFITQGKIFDAAATAANRAGEEITGVIDAFTQAYRAAGGGSNEVERFATANALLADSLTLSKLSSLDQATAIDTLSAALRQAGMGLDQGSVLLDKWVAVTKVANVDLATLATGFAVVGDAADAAGLSADELNGIIAAIAETGISSGKETANIARSIVSGFQSDAAQKQLDALGISVEDSTGKMRDLRDILKELSALRNAKVIDDTQFSKLTLAIGGGTRRQAAVSTFVENYSRAIQVAGTSANASGDAQAALANQLETVQTSITRLNNAFEELAQSMGVKGGFLGIIQGTVNLATKLVNIFDDLVSVLGKATPALAAFIATSLILKNQGFSSLQEGVGTLGSKAAATSRYVTGPFEGPNPLPSVREKVGGFAQSNIFGTNTSSAIAQGIGVSLIPALMNATNKDDKYGKTKAGADVIGGVGGAIVGSLVAGSPIIGAAVGTSIAEAFVNSTIARKTDIFAYSTGATLGDGTVRGDTTDKNAELDKAVSDIYKSIGFGNENLGKLLTSNMEKSSKAFIDKVNEDIASGGTKYKEDALASAGTSGSILNAAGISQELVREAYKSGKQIDFSPERLSYNSASDSAKRAYDIALAQRNASEPGASVTTPFTNQVISNKAAFEPLLNSIASAMKDQISGERLAGDLKGSTYKQQIESVGGFDTKALNYYTAFGKEFERINGGIKDSTDLFKAFADVTVYGSAESVNEITAIVSEIQTLVNLLNDPALKGKKELDFGGQSYTRDALQGLLSEKQNLAANLAKDTYQQAQLGRLDVPKVQGDINKPLTSGELATVKNTAIGLQEDFYKGFLKIPDQLYEGLQKSWEDWAQVVKDSGDAFYETIEGIDPQFFQSAMQKLMEENKLKSQKTDPYGIQQIDLPGSKQNELQGMVNYFSGYLSKNFPKYEQKPEELGVIFNDYVTGTLHGDNLAIKLALEKLVDINQKQLDGQYNIPEGATFWVPLTAAYYRNKGGGENMDSGTMANTSATESNTTAITGLTAALSRQASSAYGAGFGNKAATMNAKLEASGILPAAAGAQDTILTGSQVRSETMRDYLEKPYGTTLTGSQVRSETMRDGVGSNVSLTDKVPTTSFIETLRQGLATVFQSLGGGFQGIGDNPGRNVRGGFATAGGGQAPAQSTKVDLKLQSTTTLTLDGRVLASQLQNYLATDLIRTEGTQGTVTKKYII